MYYNLKCFLCKNDVNFIIYLKTEGIKYVRCQNCGLIFRKNEFGKRDLKQYENKKYFSAYIKNYKVFIEIFTDLLNTVEKYKKHGRILDIGCSIGLFLFLAKKRKWKEFGVEISIFASNFAKNRLKLNVMNSDNLDDFPNNYFDVIVLNHVLEHIENPISILKQIYKKLESNGILMIGVPNINGLFPRFQKGKWPSIKPHEHYNQFTPKTLKLLLNKSFFKPIKFNTISRNFNYKFWPLNLILNKIFNPILENLKLGEFMLIIFKKTKK